MFERYTEVARRAIFFARYEASQFGTTQIEAEHLLLGILREDGSLALRLLRSQDKIESLRGRIEQYCLERKGVPQSTSVDMPLSQECRRALAYANEEAERVRHRNISAVHLLVGISREETTFAATILRESGLTASELRQEVTRSSEPAAGAPKPQAAVPPVIRMRDLTADARGGALGLLIGREAELKRVIDILGRRTRNHPVLVGEPGVGKTTILEGLAQQIAEGNVPSSIADRRVLAIHASSLIDMQSGKIGDAAPGDAINWGSDIVCVEGLLDLKGEGPTWDTLQSAHFLEPLFARSDALWIATGTPAGLRRTMETAPALVRQFEIVEVSPADEDETARILAGVKAQYEKFHGVAYGEGVIERAIYASGRFLAHRFLPDRAIDLFDEAGSRVKLRRDAGLPGTLDLRRQIRAATRNLENAVANHEFEKARLHSDKERALRDELQRIVGESPESELPKTVTPQDVEETVADRTGLPLATVRAALQQKRPTELHLAVSELAAVLPSERYPWAPLLAGYLVGCSPEDAEKLAQAIRQAKLKLSG